MLISGVPFLQLSDLENRGRGGSPDHDALKKRVAKLEEVADKAAALSDAKADAEDLHSELLMSRKQVRTWTGGFHAHCFIVKPSKSNALLCTLQTPWLQV